MRLLIVSALFGGVLTATLVWFWQRDPVFALLVAPIGGSFAALLGAALLLAATSSSVRTALAFIHQRWSERRIGPAR